MDQHRNIYFQYSVNEKNSIEKISLLENNITKAFINTLEHSGNRFCSLFLNNLLEGKLGIKSNDNFLFDLQQVKSNYAKIIDRIKKTRNRFIIGISKYKFDYDDSKSQRFVSLLDEIESKGLGNVFLREADILYSKHIDDKVFSNKVHNLFSSLNLAANVNGIITKSDLFTIIELIIKNNIPDGWIVGKDCAILIEAKVNDNPLNVDQLIRHKKKDKYLSQSNGIIIITKTWKEIYDILESIKLPDNPISSFLCNQFKEYLIMSGNVVDINRFIEGERFPGYRKEILHAIVEKIVDSNLFLPRSKERPQFRHVWQQLGEDKNNHYSIYVNEESIEIELTLRGKYKNKLKKQEYVQLLWDSFFGKSIDKKYKHRYKIKFDDYGIFDHYKGLETGGNTYSFAKFESDLSWFNKKKNSRKLFIDTVTNYVTQFQQVGILYSIPIPNINEIKRRKKKNKPIELLALDYDDLQSVEKIVQVFKVDFINPIKVFYEKIKKL